MPQSSGVRQEMVMAHYICLMNFTSKGSEHVEDSTKRSEKFRKLAADIGVTVKDVYWTLGAYDIVCVLEAADDQAVTALALSVAKLGNVTTQTLRAFDAAEFDGIVAKML